MRSFSMRPAGVLIAATAFFTSMAGANAAYIQGTCSVTNVTANGVNATACLNYSGNDTGYSSSIAADFGVSDPWILSGKSDSAGDFVNDIGGSPQGGNWALDGSIDGLFVVVLKAANFYAAYLFEGLTGVTGGTYDVSGVTTKVNRNGSIRAGHAGLSHLSFYEGFTAFTGGGTNIITVAEPAALGLFGLGLVGLGFAGRRRQN